MANKTISKALFGLMTVALLMTAMFSAPAAEAGFNGDIAANVLTSGVSISDTTNLDDATITVTIDTDKSSAAIAGVDFTLGEWTGAAYVKSAMVTADVPKADGSIEVEFLASQVLSATTPGTYAVRLTVDELEVPADATAETFDATITVVDSTGRTDLGTNDATKQRFIDDYKVENQDGDDEINPLDTVTLTMDLEGDQRYTDMIVKARLTSGTEILSDWVESREFNLANEQEMTLNEFEFGVEEIVENGQLYTIEVMVDSDEAEFDAAYTFTVELEDDTLAIRNLDLSSTSVNAGDSITLTTRVYNNGQDVQEDIEISAEIAELGIKVESFDTIGTLGNADYEEWTATFGVPASAAAGAYTLEITAESKDGARVTETVAIQVAGTTAAKDAEFDAEARTLDVNADGATYTLTLTNNGNSVETYELSVEGADWANVELDNEVVIEAGMSKTIEVTVTPLAGETGNQQFTINAEADGENVDEITLNANLTGEDVQEQVIQVLQWVFAVIIIIAIILVIVWAVTKGRKGEDGAYY